MRTNSDFFDEFNQAAQKELRLVIVIDFPTPLYLTSHAGIPNIPAGQIDDVVQDVSSISQRLIPDAGRSEIGSLSFSVIDKASAITDRFRSEQAAGEGLKGRKVELYRGGSNIAGGSDTDWTEFRVEQTVQIEGAVAYEKGAYKISCSDIQREMRHDIFDLAKTRLRTNFDQGAATIDVFSTDDFELCSHVASFGDQPTGSFFYFKIKYQNGFEIVRATGKTGGGTPTFTGCVRGLFGTTDVDHVLTAETGPTTGIEIEEYVYLELPAPAMAVALLTGNIPGGGTLPARWNLGIAAGFINQSSFDDIGSDWFDSADYTKGLIFRFQSITKTDGKKFIEREVCLLAGAFLLIGADGKISMRRMTGVISSADFVHEINPDNAIAHGAVTHNLSKVRNQFDIEWSWLQFPGDTKPRFLRRDILVDATSIGLHGDAKPLPLQFRGLHNDRHTFTTLINRFDALRDRYAGPPLTLRVDLLPHLNDLEVGDIVRATFPNVRDFTETDTLDRSFEIQRISINQKTGRVTCELFGSSQKADPIADEDAGATSELPDSWYNSEGTDANTPLSIDGSGILLSSGTLAGGTTTRTIFYVLGNFSIPAGLTVTITGNVELRVRGVLQINGDFDATGGGLAANTAGFIGTTYGGRGVLVRGPTPTDFEAARIFGLNAAMPVLEIENDAGVLVGVPPDMRGSGGGTGGHVKDFDTTIFVIEAFGGVGGAGGGSLVTVSRGVAYGVSGEVIISGADGSTGGTFGAHDAGSGGGGAPGTLLHLLDGRSVVFPIMVGNVDASYGTSPLTNGNFATQGKALASIPIDLGVSNARVAYVPDSRIPYPDGDNDDFNDGDGSSLIVAAAYLRKATAPTTPIADDGQYDFGTKVLTPPSITGGSADNWSATVPAGADPLYVTHGTFEVVGSTGIDSTVTWTAPQILVSDGADGGDGNSVHVAQIFLRKSTQPATPIDDDGEYNFGTNVLTAPSVAGGSADNWLVSVPSGAQPLAVSAGTFEVNGTTGIDSTVTWTMPVILASDGADGADGAPGIPGASTITRYDDLQTTGNVSSAGMYAFLTVLAETNGTDVWSTITSLGGVDYLNIRVLETGGTPDNSDFYDEIEIGDVVTWWDSDRRWVEFRITSVETPLANRRKWGITLVEFDQDDGSQNIPTAGGNDVELRFSRSRSGGDGLDGSNGLPGASYIADYDNADTNGSSSSAGRYHFLPTSADTGGTFNWDQITAQSGDIVDFFSLHEESTGGSPDNSGAFDEVEVGDVMAWWISNTKWVSFRIDSIETAPANMNKWGVSYIAHEGTGDISGTGGVNVEIRFSRAFKFTLTIGDISELALLHGTATIPQESAMRVNTTGVLQTQEDNGSWVTEETWRGNGANADYDVKVSAFEGSDAFDDSAGEDVWLSCSSIRRWSVRNNSNGQTQDSEGTMSFRDADTKVVLATIPYHLLAFDL